MLNWTICPVTAFYQNSTLLWDDDTGEAVLTDVGGDVEYLLDQIQKRDLTLTALWLTHTHLDHIGGVGELLTHCAVPVLGPHRADSCWLDCLHEQVKKYQFPPALSFNPQWLSEGDRVSVGQYQFDVLHIPGHTPGSLVYHCATEKLLITGDVLFLESVGRTDFPFGNTQDLLSGIRTKLYSLPDDTRVIAGHGANTTIGHEKKHNPFVHD